MFNIFKIGLTRNIVWLGVVSGLTDISSEMIYPLVPLFLTGVLHAPMSVVGLVEGIAEGTASLLKAVGGLWSDRARKRKPFVTGGYALSAVSKPLIALASSWVFVLFARFFDRVGKGLRTSARDALIAASVDKAHWGKAFGFHRAMDTLGAAAGPLVALLLLNYFGFSYRQIFTLAFIPAAAGVFVLVLLVRENVDDFKPQKENAGWSDGLKTLTPEFKKFVFCYAIFALGNSSDVFLLMKAKAAGFTATQVILAYVTYNIVYALCATPAGWLADRLGRVKTLSFGLAVFSAVYLGFAFIKSPGLIWLLFAVYGFYGACTEGIAKAIVADLTKGGNRATAMGVFNGVTGVLAFAASAVAGLLWTKVSPAAPFAVGFACALACALILRTVKESSA